MYSLFQRFLFLLPPETAHRWVMNLIDVPFINRFLKIFYKVEHSSLQREFFGLRFKNPVGLAAGFDKDGKHIRALQTLGFGFIELGTVTPLPQPGNPKPRLFRLKSEEALINRMGFNNDGVDALVKRLTVLKNRDFIIGGNIGKNKITPNERAFEDYEICFRKLFEYVDYFAVNVSSPNTPGLRELQEKEPLIQILQHLMTINNSNDRPKPIFLKIAPDLSDSQLNDILEIVEITGIQGIIATNTTIGREGISIATEKLKNIGSGGLSGKPLFDRSTYVIDYLNQKSNGQIFLIAVGGIMNEKDALKKIEAGASLVQVYSGLIFKGPALIQKINKTLIKSHIS
ncbi:MAG: hypothetical protein RJA52_1321 [Bacteroidota bacterium]